MKQTEKAPPRTAHAATALGPNGVVSRAAESIRTMQVRGAGKIARSAAMALAEFAHSWKGAKPRDLYKELEASAKLLLATRPTAVSLRNAVNLTLAPAREAAKADGNVDDVRRCAYEAGTRFAHDSVLAVEKVAARVAEWLPKRATVLTHCNSQAAVEAIKAAHESGRKVKAICTESRPWFQGHLTARQLDEAGIDTTFVVDSAAYEAMAAQKVDAVVVGADTVLGGGSLMNKIGTVQVALAAKDLGVPFYVAAESYKFSPFDERPPIEERDVEEVLKPAPASFRELGVTVRNAVFDETPPRLIERFATEHKALRPDECAAYVRATFGDVREWI